MEKTLNLSAQAQLNIKPWHREGAFMLTISTESGAMYVTGGETAIREIIDCLQSYLPPKQKTLPDTEMLDRLEQLTKQKCWKLVFNRDDTDGYFCTVDHRYSHFNTNQVADISDNTKRFTLRESISAAIEYLETI